MTKSPTGREPAALEPVRDPVRASILFTPLRLEILDRARRRPCSATEIARELALPRQRVGYHVRELAGGGFLRKAGRVRRRNFYEQRYRASARSYLVAPEVLGPVAAGKVEPEDRASAGYLLYQSARLQTELVRSMEQAGAAGKRLATLTLDADLRFASAAQRDRFTRELRDAVARVIADHTSPSVLDDGSPGMGRPYRLVLGCYPVPEAGAGTEETRS
ncbi:MAG TPA: winged helix-turn-helix domain-containing protein [Thermoanaerobaculia bacterium]|nr:winged helix-turn-helix domain-containing protein [Thermoanaerobaculia bacterium]